MKWVFLKNVTVGLCMMAAVATGQGFDKEIVVQGLKDPMSIAHAPDGSVYIVEREGRILRVDAKTGACFEAGKIDVYALRKEDPDSPSGREDALHDIAFDPQFLDNHFVYLYYSHPQEALNRLSRFTLENGLLVPSSEKVILDVPTLRHDRVCHHGGSLKFGPDGLLYLSIGDNTNPFESDGYNPVDQRPDREPWDTSLRASNTADLRGKIIRIRLTDDGYSIPDGNLFASSNNPSQARPEIYIMGCRNPFRTSIDPKTGTLYWGEIGPDAGEDGPRGPRGYDEINQAKSAGNYGWPWFIADNQAYARYDFQTQEIGPKQHSNSPQNLNPQAAGIKDLPPAQPAMIWYPYATSERYPVLGSGGRNAMAGPVFYYDANRPINMLDAAEDGTLITYDWMRGSIFKVKLDSSENMQSLSLLDEGHQYPIDLEMADDGSLWLLEYGTEWWFNGNGNLSRLTPKSDNRAPKVNIVRSDNGKEFKAEASDEDGDSLTIDWWVTDGVKDQSIGQGASIKMTNSMRGDEIRAVVKDSKGARAIARLSLLEKPIEPALKLALQPAPKSITDGELIHFRVMTNAPLDASKVVVRIRHIPATGHDAGGPQLSSEEQTFMTSKQCLACHQVEHTSLGPPLLNIALKYRHQEDAVTYLSDKIHKGGGGVWGAIPMPAQPSLSPEETARLVKIVLGLGNGMAQISGQIEGKLAANSSAPKSDERGAWEISAMAPGFTTVKMRLPEH
ncbi:MAG: hypothetical protein EAZ42_04510 [Verrucomicrobia bacterium]|nr:MAG: hypothetical protein EAZ42_04510 [Verrucomicrobiota bacterium]